MPEQIGLPARHGRAVSLEEGAGPNATRCPACGQPLFVWLETTGYGAREDQVIDRCENCGLVAVRDSVPSPGEATDAFLATGEQRGARTAIRAENAGSLQAWLGAENWSALRPTGKRVAPASHGLLLSEHPHITPSRHGIKPTPRAARLLLARRGLEVQRVRHLARAGMASMWQTLLNLLTFHRDFASEAASGRLRAGTGRGVAAFATDAVITVLAAVPTAIIAVLLEGGAVIARRGGVIEVEAERLPSTD